MVLDFGSDWANVIDSIPQAVWVADARGDVEFFNRHAVELVGLPAVLMKGRGWLDLVHPDDALEARGAFERGIRGESRYHGRFRLRTADGTYGCFVSDARVVRGADSQVAGWVGTWIDCDAAKRTDGELRNTDRIPGEGVRHGGTAPRQARGYGRGQRRGLTDGVAGRRAQLEAERALRHALEHQELRLYYQPKLSFESNRMTGAEALVRWEAPGRGLVHPLEFIPLAEATGLIIPIGTWVIEQACRQAAEWDRRFRRQPALVMSVNLSAHQFGPSLIDVVAAALAHAGTDPNQLCLEVTESVLIGDPDAAVATLSGLAKLGVKLSIDDFGTGYSSLSHLKRFPFHELKIDKCFVDGLGEGTKDTAIVAATVAMAHALGLSVVAEGVETHDQFERLRVLGCQEAQGYLISRPQPSAIATQLLSVDAWPALEPGAPVGRDGHAEAYRAQRVLVIDDAADVRQLTQMTLVAAGFGVEAFANGADALTVARRTCPDCVIVDVAMPDMSGFEVCRALRADPLTAECTIVMLSASTDAADKIEAVSCGADDYVIKPFSPRDLTGRVRAAMGRRDKTSISHFFGHEPRTPE